MSPKATRSRPKILCIDDDPSITTAVPRRLASYEVDVLTVADGTAEMWQAIEGLPDVILTDLQMPSGDGNGSDESSHGPSGTGLILVIALTGKPDNKTQRWLQILGVTLHSRKPLQIEKLLCAWPCQPTRQG